MGYKLKQKDSHINKRAVLIGLVAVVLLSALAYVFLANDNKTTPAKDPNTRLRENDINYQPPTDAQKDQGEKAKVDNFDKPAADPDTTTDKTATITTIRQSAGSREVTAQTELKPGYWNSCTLTLTNAAATVSKTSKTIYQEAFSTCMGFSIPVSELSPGAWQAVLTAEASDGTIVRSKETTVTVN